MRQPTTGAARQLGHDNSRPSGTPPQCTYISATPTKFKRCDFTKKEKPLKQSIITEQLFPWLLVSQIITKLLWAASDQDEENGTFVASLWTSLPRCRNVACRRENRKEVILVRQQARFSCCSLTTSSCGIPIGKAYVRSSACGGGTRGVKQETTRVGGA